MIEAQGSAASQLAQTDRMRCDKCREEGQKHENGDFARAGQGRNPYLLKLALHMKRMQIAISLSPFRLGSTGSHSDGEESLDQALAYAVRHPIATTILRLGDSRIS